MCPQKFFPKYFLAYLASLFFFFLVYLGPKKDLGPHLSSTFIVFFYLFQFFFYAILINFADSQEKMSLHLLPLAKTSLWKDEKLSFAKSFGESRKEISFLLKNFLLFMPSQPPNQGIIIFNLFFFFFFFFFPLLLSFYRLC